MASTVLIVEDDVAIRRFVRAALEEEGLQVVEAGTMSRGLIEAATRQPDLIILDLGLPDGNGINLLKDLRGWASVPVIVLSARVGETDKIQALDAGADDYLTKPFSIGELQARVRAQLRRHASRNGAVQSSLERFGAVEVDLLNRTVTRNGAPLHLTKLEYRLLSTLIAHRGKVLTHRQLLNEVWGPAYIEHTHYLRIYMTHLRQKVEDNASQPRWLLTETGIGYRLAAE
ncbi:two-component system response regulator KdpE [Crenobacter sp. HX-7-9]|uniref:Two-component system response regulator KdpE n=1 Tax=Crenobacter caeni TaxID=2705474 RepID=A0A6B2KSN4_9NEIS|nr:two-component system response regulator KdpE [Crenobacter caeni]